MQGEATNIPPPHLLPLACKPASEVYLSEITSASHLPLLQSYIAPEFLWEGLQGFHLDERVLLGPHPLPTGAVMVHARLLVLRGEDCVPGGGAGTGSYIPFQ